MDFSYHRPVMLDEIVALLRPAPGKVILDGTLGGGGHTEALLQQGATVIAVDKDPEALETAACRLEVFKDRFIPVRGDFRYLNSYVAQTGRDRVDGVLLDLGVSSHQLDTPRRGFSYRDDAPLDMRMDTGQEKTAAHLVNQLSREQLTAVIRDFGEERWAFRIAGEIVRRRQKQPFRTTGQLEEAIRAAIPAAARRKGPHPARRTFQALRIAVNDELAALTDALQAGISCLGPEGRIAVISYHSLEDRIVKNTFRQGEHPCICPPRQPICTCGRLPYLKVLTRQPLYPQPQEVEANPRARSAKLRVAEVIGSKHREGE